MSNARHVATCQAVAHPHHIRLESAHQYANSLASEQPPALSNYQYQAPGAKLQGLRRYHAISPGFPSDRIRVSKPGAGYFPCNFIVSVDSYAPAAYTLSRALSQA